MTPNQPQRDVLIPVVLDGAGRLVRCDDAAKGPFSCPGCGGAVVARRGTTRRWHFAHAGGGCSPETAEHAAAKMMLAGVLGGEESRRGVRVPTFCAGCGRGAAVPLSLAFDRTSVEARIGAYVVDVALWRGERMVGAVEVRRTHAVDEAKARGLDVPWVELNAVDILEDALVWKPVAGDLHRVRGEGEPAEHVCAACEERLGEMAEMVGGGGVPVECAACGGVCAARLEGGAWVVAACGSCGAPGRMPPEGSALGRAAARVAATGGSKGTLAAYAVIVERMGW
jgi:ribosomal protein L37AE/L43A